MTVVVRTAKSKNVAPCDNITTGKKHVNFYALLMMNKWCHWCINIDNIWAYSLNLLLVYIIFIKRKDEHIFQCGENSLFSRKVSLYSDPLLIHLILYFQSHWLSCRLVSANEAKQGLVQRVHFQEASCSTLFWEHMSEKQKMSALKGFLQEQSKPQITKKSW